MVDPNELRKAIKTASNKNKRFMSKKHDPRYAGYTRGLLAPEKTYSMQLFRRISEKAWLINTLIGHIIDKTVPYIRPMSAKGARGFAIELKDPNAKMSKAEEKEATQIQEFFLKTSWPEIKNDSELAAGHEDDLIHYTKKILRDVLTLDQVASEKLWTRGNKLLAFEAIDAATIVKCTEEGYAGDDQIRYVQIIDQQIATQYQQRQI
ncbi:MAG: hypothetical protein KAJ19_27700, partial [Gammaproteobacteria bacterium]|nr:hypothetical protein [Gammaproteobacteria bacterium]